MRIFAILMPLLLLAGCSTTPKDDDFKLDKFIESKIYDDIARSAERFCREKAPNGGIATEFLVELNRDVFQRTISYGNLSVGEQGVILSVICPGDLPAVAEFPEWWFDTGWSPGQPPGKYTRMGIAPKGWNFTPYNWLWEWERRHCQVRPDKCQIDL